MPSLPEPLCTLNALMPGNSLFYSKHMDDNRGGFWQEMTTPGGLAGP
jgi:hypothetical protein